MSNTIEDLRAVLFEALNGAKDGTLDIERVRAINDVAQTLVNTAKAEVDYIKATGSAGSGFLAGNQTRPALTGAQTTERTGNGSRTIVALENGATVTTHRMRG